MSPATRSVVTSTKSKQASPTLAARRDKHELGYVTWAILRDREKVTRKFEPRLQQWSHPGGLTRMAGRRSSRASATTNRRRVAGPVRRSPPSGSAGAPSPQRFAVATSGDRVPASRSRRAPPRQMSAIWRGAVMSMVGSPSTSNRSARNPGAIRPRSVSPKCRAGRAMAAFRASEG